MNKKGLMHIINRGLGLFDAKLVRASTSCVMPDRLSKPTDLFCMEELIARLCSRVEQIGCVVDIGASNGKWSLLCKRYIPDAAYLAVEPLQEQEAALQKIKGSIKRFEYALCVAGEKDGQKVCLNVTGDLDGSAVNGENAGSSRMCPVRSIDSLIAEHSMPRPFLLKFDTHGYELPILNGAKKTLMDTAAIIMEVYNYELTPESLKFYDMCVHLEKEGFRPADLADPMLRPYDHTFWQIDILFLRSEANVFRYRQYR